MGNLQAERTVGVGGGGNRRRGRRRNGRTGQLGTRAVLNRAGYYGGVGWAAASTAAVAVRSVSTAAAAVFSARRGTGGQKYRRRAEGAEEPKTVYPPLEIRSYLGGGGDSLCI